MAIRQYIGARYVLKIYENSLDPQSADWEPGVVYEPLVMVTYNNSSYVSRKTVPANIGDPVSNPSYWALSGLYNGQIANLQSEINNIKDNSIYFNVCFPPSDYSGNALDNTGINDVTNDLQAIIDYVGSHGDGGTIYFPEGKYLIDGTITVPYRKMRFLGESRGSVYFIHDLDVTMFTITGQNNVVFEKILFKNNFPLPTTSAYFLDFDAGNYHFVVDCMFYDSCRYIHFNNTGGFRIDNVLIDSNTNIPNQSSAGIYITGSCPSSQIYKLSCNFKNLSASGVAVLCEQYAQDLYIERIETVGCSTAILIRNQYAANPGDIIINNGIFDLLKGPAISLQDIKGATYKNTCIITNMYATSYKDSINIVRIQGCENVVIKGLGISNPHANNTIVGVSVYNSDDVVISDCAFTELTRGCVIEGSSNVVVNGNTIKNDNGSTVGVGFYGTTNHSVCNANAIKGYSAPVKCGDTSDYLIVTSNIINAGTIDTSTSGTHLSLANNL